jgi:DNA-binding PadR family transcriptional regulator
MKGGQTQKILEALYEQALGAADLFDVLLTLGYGVSWAKLDYELEKRRAARVADAAQTVNQDTRRKQRYYNLLYSLKRDGLIAMRKKSSKTVFALTEKGKIKLQFLRKRSAVSLPAARYIQNGAKRFIIITFDIPEADRRKRG